MPGLIEGAAEGKGLGHRFLRHVVRCRALVLVVDLAAPDPAADLGVLRAELAAYDETLAARPAVIAGTKADLVEEPARPAAALEGEVVVVSSMTGDGVDELLERLGLLAQEGATVEAEYQPTVVLRPGRPRFTVVRRADGGWEVSGRSVERWIEETDLEDDREVAQLQTRLKKEGVDRKLAALGAKRGTTSTSRAGSSSTCPMRTRRAVGARRCLTRDRLLAEEALAPWRWPACSRRSPRSAGPNRP